jgi:SAM-dependent methyltransferase
MAHKEQRAFFQTLQIFHPKYFKNAKVCEIGSLNINGSIRENFTECEYIGYDINQGTGVDQVAQGQLIGAMTGHFDTMVSAECFEHNPYWVETFANMLRMTRPGGMVAFSCASTGRPEHGTTRTTPGHSPLTVGQGWEYYKNLVDADFVNIFNMAGWFHTYQFFFCPSSFDLYFCGFTKGNNTASTLDNLRMSLANKIGAVPLHKMTTRS